MWEKVSLVLERGQRLHHPRKTFRVTLQLPVIHILGFQCLSRVQLISVSEFPILDAWSGNGNQDPLVESYA